MSLRRSVLAAFLLAPSSFTLQRLARAEASINVSLESRVQALLPEIEAYVASAMTGFGVPGVAMGIIIGDTLQYAKGFGVRSKSSGLPVDTRTIFQIGSTSKAFLAATQAIMVDRGALRWDDRIVDLYPEFELQDPWVTREFRVFDLLAQRSGLPPFVNDALAMFDFSEAAMIRSLRYVPPVSSFRTTFSYTNITHVLASRIVASVGGAADWNAVLKRDLLEPLGMKESTTTAEAIETAANHATGHSWTPDDVTEVPFTPIFPYHYYGAGSINSNIEDMAQWVRMQLGNGRFDGRTIVSAENLAVTHTPKVAINSTTTYALGWIAYQTPNGNILYHGGETLSFGAFVGLVPARKIGVIILTNVQNVGFPDAVGIWTLDRLLDNPETDHVANILKAAKTGFEAGARVFARPSSPQPILPLAPLAGKFVNPSFGEVAVKVEGESLVMELKATGAKLKVEPWDGDIFVAQLMPAGQFKPIVDLGYMARGFVQFQIDIDGKRNLLQLSLADGQTYAFRRR